MLIRQYQPMTRIYELSVKLEYSAYWPVKPDRVERDTERVLDLLREDGAGVLAAKTEGPNGAHLTVRYAVEVGKKSPARRPRELECYMLGPMTVIGSCLKRRAFSDITDDEILAARIHKSKSAKEA